MKYKYSIYQTNANYAFVSFNNVNNFSFTDYICVCDSKIFSDIDISHIEILEELFEIFNIHRPGDYKSRSMSVSDIVKIEDSRGVFYYYCDSIGWTNITKMIGSKYMRIDKYEPVVPNEKKLGKCSHTRLNVL